VAQGVPGRLKHRIFLTFGSTEVVSRQPYAPAAFTPGEIPGTHFQELSRPQGTWFLRGEPQKKIPSDTTGNRSRDRSNTLPRAPYIYIYIYIYIYTQRNTNLNVFVLQLFLSRAVENPFLNMCIKNTLRLITFIRWVRHFVHLL